MKLVAEVGVGTVAAGVAKAGADHVLISGHDGGTGASPASRIFHAGIPWEIGLAETQQTLVLNDLRVAHLGADGRPAEDGPRRRGRGAARRRRRASRTAPLTPTGCVTMPACHLNTWSGRDRDPGSRASKAIPGEPEHVVNLLFFVAEEARGLMARSACAGSRSSWAGLTCWRETVRSRVGGSAGSISRMPRPARGAARRRLAACVRRSRRSATRSTGSSSNGLARARARTPVRVSFRSGSSTAVRRHPFAPAHEGARSRGPATGDDPVRLPRLRGPVVRRLVLVEASS